VSAEGWPERPLPFDHSTYPRRDRPAELEAAAEIVRLARIGAPAGEIAAAMQRHFPHACRGSSWHRSLVARVARRQGGKRPRRLP
jgi:hypothetical protein